MSTGTVDGVLLKWGEGGPNGSAGTGTEALSGRVQLEFAANKKVSLVIRDSVESSGATNREGIFTSKDTLTVNAKPVLIVDYTPPTAEECEGPELLITGFNGDGGPFTIEELNDPAGAEFSIGFRLTAACEDFTSIKVQGGLAGNLSVVNSEITTYEPEAGDNECLDGGTAGIQDVGSAELIQQPGKGANQLVKWTGFDLDEGESACLRLTLKVSATNPSSKNKKFSSAQECAAYPITGRWGATAVWYDENNIPTPVTSIPAETDRLVVSTVCPGVE